MKSCIRVSLEKCDGNGSLAAWNGKGPDEESDRNIQEQSCEDRLIGGRGRIKHVLDLIDFLQLTGWRQGVERAHWKM